MSFRRVHTVRVAALSALFSLIFFASSVREASAQDHTTGNQFINGRVLGGDGALFVMLPPARVGLDPLLDFYDKCFFTAKIGSTYFTNNNVIAPLPGNAKRLASPDSAYNFGIHGDTVRIVWNNRNGVDIIQDIWPVAFTKSGQIVARWSFRTRDTSQIIPIQCQWLNDVDISDPRDNRPNNANDGPWFLHRWGYYNQNQQYPNNTVTPNLPIPWFYICFLYNIPGPNDNPGLAGQGYLDYPLIGTTKPFRVTMADWYTLAATIFGPNPSIKTGQIPGPDDAILIEFNPTNVGGKYKQVIGGATSYGTGEFEECVGNMFGLLFYPHKIVWDKVKHVYNPTPINIELYAFNPNQSSSAFNSQFTLTVGPNMTICDSLNTKVFANGQTFPVPPATMVPGGVLVLDWFAKANPVYFCTGDFIGQIKITGTSSLGPVSYTDPTGVFGDTCEHGITIGCAETDTLPPYFTTAVSGSFADSVLLTVADNRTTPIIDRGLKSITWKPTSPSTNVNNFTIALLDSIKPCFNDLAKHRVHFAQLDSTIGGCFDFTFIDCMGNQSDTTICFAAHIVPSTPDTLKPRILVVEQSGTFNGSDCNQRFDSLLVTDNRQYDRGVDSVVVIPGSDSNMALIIGKFPSGNPYVRFSIHVIDSMKDGAICIHAVDAARPPNAGKPQNFRDTCFYYCTIKDTLAPRIEIIQGTALWKWHVHVHDDAPWDRKINTISIVNGNNVTIPNPPLAGANGQSVFDFDIQAADTTVVANFCVQATDLAFNTKLGGNVSDTVCARSGVDTDALKPNILFNPDPSTNPTVLTTSINDVHYIGGIKYVWDTGIDSVWFTNNSGIVTPWPVGRKFNCDSVVPDFSLQVLDSLLAVTSPACVTVNAVDCHGNLTTKQWCYPYTPDSLPPFMVVKYVKKDSVQITLTDDRIYDRGLFSFQTLGPINLNLTTVMLQQRPDTSFRLGRQPDQSTMATLQTIDFWGSVFASEQLKHSAIAPIRIWVQDLALKKGLEVLPTSASFEVPVFLVHNDTSKTITLQMKGIDTFQFMFAMRGSPGAAQFTGIRSSLTNAGWTITPVPSAGGDSITVTGIAPAGKVLQQSDIADADTILYLQFKPTPTQSTQNILLEIEPVGGETVIYNGGHDTVFNGLPLSLNAISTMPPPWGTLSGGNIVVVGNCAPAIRTGSTSKIVSLDVPTPNPVAKSVTLHYTVASEGTVHLGVYDMVGRQVRDLVNDTQKEGAYDLTLDVTGIPDAEYSVRLETGGTVVSRKIAVEK